MTILLSIVLGAMLGGSLGSFAGVVRERVPQGRSVAFPGSRCETCLGAIAPKDNVPIFSWLLLRGRCRRCGAPIPKRLLAVEVFGLTLGAGLGLLAGFRGH